MEEEEGVVAAMQQSVGKKRKREKDGKEGKKPKAPQESREAPPEGRCNFWVVRRGRFCHLTPVPDDKFCLAHSPTQEKLICPHCKNPIVTQRNMRKHLPKCPKKKRDDLLKSQPYYSAGINLLPKGDEQTIHEAGHKPLAQIPYEQLKEFVDKINTLHSQLCPTPLPTEMLRHPGCETFFESRTYKVKHLTQETSIIEHLNQMGFLAEDCIYIDFGAGKGTLSHLLQVCSNGVNILVDRQNVKRKAEGQMQRMGRQCKRLAIDIVDLNLDGVPELHEKKRIVAVGKHLCGGASDMAIRCASKTLKSAQMEALAIALCCHHRCSWDTYINHKFLLELGITEKEFETMRLMTSWAVCCFPQLSKEDTKGSKEEGKKEEIKTERAHIEAESSYDALTPEQKLTIGRKCKEILDYGRSLALQELGYTTRLVHYVEPSISLENTLLMAIKKT